jgi:hypothetical protein
MWRAIFVLVLILGCVGYFRGWFMVSSTTTIDGKSNVTVTVDKDKIHSDDEAAREKAKALEAQH